MSKTRETEGVVFRSMKYSETSLILDIYTLEYGLLSFIVSGVRKAKSKLANIYHPMNIIDIVAIGSDDKLSRIKEGRLAVRYDDLSFNVIKSSISMFIIDLARNAIKEKERNQELYSFLKNFLRGIDKGLYDLKYVPMLFAIRLTHFLGFEITNNYTLIDKYFDLKEGFFVDKNVGHNYILNENLSLLLYQFLNKENPQIGKDDRNTLLDYILDYYRYHIEGFRPLKSLDVLRAVLS